MHVQTLAIPGAIPWPLLYQGVVPGPRPTQIIISPRSHLQLSILEYSRYKLRIDYGLTLVTPSLCRWEVFPTPGALTPTVPQVPGVTPVSPLCPWCFKHSSWRGARYYVRFLTWHCNGIFGHHMCMTIAMLELCFFLG